MRWTYSDNCYWLDIGGRICGFVTRRFRWFWYAEAFHGLTSANKKSKMFRKQEDAHIWLKEQFTILAWKEKEGLL